MASKARHAIEQRIADLSLTPGSIVSERELAEAIGFGKAAVREALQRLSIVGLVSPRTGSGYRVAPITLSSARNLFEMWRSVEPAAVSAALRRGLSAEVLELFEKLGREPIEVSGGADVGPPEEAHLFTELIFHVVVVVTSDNPWFQQLFVSAMTEVERLLRFAYRLGADFEEEGFAAHDSFLKALRAGDEDVVVQTCLDHINRLERLVFDALLNSAVTGDVNLAAAAPPPGRRATSAPTSGVPPAT